MRKVKAILSLILFVAFASCSGIGLREMISSDGGVLEVSPGDSDILYMGRILWADSTAPTFSYPGTTAMLNFEGDGIAMKASSGSGQFMVEIDSLPPFKINFTAADTLIVLADSLDEGLPHLVRVTYAIEGYEKHPEFHGFVITGKKRKLLPAPQRPELKIEFIGNSITCGYGTEAASEKIPFSYDTENHTLSYAYRTARALNADFNVVARSGIGMYRSYNGPREGTPDHRMPGEYDRTLLYDTAHYWDHRSFQPDIICINLGTNDTSRDNYDINLFEEAYKKFLVHLRMMQPQAKIVLLTGPMLGGQALADVKSSLDRLAAADDNIYRFDMSEQTGELGYGADYHPSAAQAARNGDELTEFLRTLL